MNRAHPSFYLISMAVDGNENAMEKLLEFYEPYISKCCLRPFYDEYGNVCIVVDEYYGAAEPPVRCGVSHLSGLTEPPVYSYSA